jgi:hypothetical protein
MERLWQFRISSRTRLPLFPTEESQRKAVRALASIGIGRLVLFNLVVEHGHTVELCLDERVGLLRRTMRQVLEPIAAQSIEPVWCEPVGGRKHMRSLVRYTLTQVEHHRIPGHAALWSGSCFLDLAGARVLPGLKLALAEAIPDLRLSEVYTMVGLPPRQLQPVSDEELRALGAGRLAAATAAALALDLPFSTRRVEVVEARRLIVQVARRLDLPWGEIRRVLQIPERTLFRSATMPVNTPGLERAVRIRLALEETLRRTIDPAVARPRVAGFWV